MKSGMRLDTSIGTANIPRATIALGVIVACQAVALQVVLRAWQSANAATVFVGIGLSALLLLCAVVIFLHSRKRDGRGNTV